MSNGTHPDPADVRVLNENARSSHFRSTRYVIRAALAAAIIFPLLYLVASSWQDWKDRLVSATDATERSTRIAQEHAIKILDIDTALIQRVLDAVGDADDASIRSREPAFHSLLQRLGGGYPQVLAISIFGRDGSLLASSRFFPSPAVTIADRPDFQDALSRPQEMRISGPMRGKVKNLRTFNVSRARTDTRGHFLGMVSIAMQPEYFEGFYRDLLGEDGLMNIGLLRADGAILAWHPPLKRPAAAVAPGTPFANAISRATPSGIVIMQSTVDGERKILAFRRVGAYDAYVSSGYPVSAVRSAWLMRTGAISAATLIPSCALWYFLLFSLRRLKREESAWQKLAEEALLRQQLESNQQEVQRREMLGSLVGVVAHDFNNLMAAISSHAQAGLASQSISRLHDALRGVESAVLAGQGLTHRLLAVAGKQPLRAQAATLVQWLRNPRLVDTALGDAITLRLQIDDNLWPVYVDLSELEVALLNLAINARDAMPSGGVVTLSASNTRARNVAALNREDADYVRITVSDTGHGMTQETARRAFDPFFTTKPVGKGSGLGLSQVRAFCERMGGFVSLETSLTTGTSVCLCLPRSNEPEESADEHKGRASIMARERLHLLLVEDDALVAEAQQAMLESMGHCVEWKPDAIQALRRLKEEHDFNAVLSDVQMPGGMSGIDLFETLKAEQPHLPIILITGFAEDVKRLEAIGVTAFLKPVRADALNNHLSRVTHG
ncbi:hybrid sensor histidine kinase/response regulator [Paraburkholderia franconis]|nr:hybrid sensor histidine kinase/response regulator [Paraburkholderia franconis]